MRPLQDCVWLMVQNKQKSVSLVGHYSDRLSVVSVRVNHPNVSVCNWENAQFSRIVSMLGSKIMKNLVTWITSSVERHPRGTLPLPTTKVSKSFNAANLFTSNTKIQDHCLNMMVPLKLLVCLNTAHGCNKPNYNHNYNCTRMKPTEHLFGTSFVQTMFGSYTELER